jgi:hypothetical protein
MSRFPRATRSPLTLVLVPLTLFFVLTLLVPVASAQIVDQDTLVDTLAADTARSTAEYLKQLRNLRVRLPVLPQLGVEGPRPPLTRIVFTRDSIEWGNAATVGDLLTQVPGVFLWRGGFIGRPEPVSYEGRGATSAEYYLDGVPYVAAGVDSIGVDPALFSISFLERIEVERWPGQIRVYLFTRQHDLLAPRSRIAVARGDNNFARYEASLERRFRSGPGFALGGDYLSSPTASGRSSTYSNTQLWAQGSYIRSPKFGVQYQLIRSAPNRRPYVINPGTTGDTIGLGFKARRTDAQFRVTLRNREDGLGPRVDLMYARTAWDGSGLDQQINQLGGYVTFRAPSYSVGGSVFHRTRWTPLDARGTIGWNPIPPFSASAELGYQHHFGGRTSQFANVAAGLQLVRGLAITGTARVGKVVAAPALLSDTAQKVRDFQGALGWNRARLGFEVSYARTSAFSPFSYAEFLLVPQLAPTPETEWITGSARIAPLQWLTLEGWYSEPRNSTVDGVPPKHSMVAGTIRSKFLRQFPSGIFDLKLRLSMETWSDGVQGRDALGNPIPLAAATFFRTLLQIQLDRFTIYWDRSNLTTQKHTYVPGFRIPGLGSNFGVRWEFFN